MFGIKTGIKVLDKIEIKIDPIAPMPIRVSVPGDKGMVGSAINQADQLNGLPSTIISTPGAVKDAADAAKHTADAGKGAADSAKAAADAARTLFEKMTATLNGVEQHVDGVLMSLKAALGGFAFHVIVGLVIVILALVAGYLIAKIYRTLRPVSA